MSDVDRRRVQTEKPPPRNREQTEKRLLQAGLEIFAQQGFHRAHVSDVAKKAHANVALINRYFGGKEGLLLAIVESIIAEKQSGELPYPPAQTLCDETRQYLLFRYREDRRLRNVLRLAIAELATNDAFREKALKTLTYAEDANFRDRLRKLQADGKVDADADLVEVFRLISLFSFAAAFVEGEILATPAEQTESLLAVFADSIGARFTRALPGKSI